MICYRHCDPRFPFLLEAPAQPGARWNANGDGPVQYLADSPDGAWAEFLRHEEITDSADLAGVRRAMWAIELPELPPDRPRLRESQLLGGLESYAACQAESRRLRARGAAGLTARSAALLPGGAHGWHVRGGATHAARARDGQTIVLFGPRDDLVGWCAAHEGRPEDRLLARVRPLRARR